MQNLDKRLTALETVRGAGFAHLTDEQLDARIATLRERIIAAENLSNEEDDHAEP